MILLFVPALYHAQIQFEQVPPPPPEPQNIANFVAVSWSSIAFADVDGDNDPDAILTGSSGAGPISKLYINDGIGNYTQAIGTPFVGVTGSSIAFADVDGDEDPDVLITGSKANNQRISRLYTNDGSGNYTVVFGTPFDGVYNSSIAFADVDGDEDQDVLVTGLNSSGQYIAKLYTNDGNGNYALVSGTPFDGVHRSSIAFADVDGDEDPDVLITGLNGPYQPIAKLYTNDGSGNYTLASDTPFEGVYDSSIAFADVDGDEYPDVLITGINSSFIRSTKLYINDGSGNYTLATGTPFEGVRNSSIAFADVDGDNDADVMLTGSSVTGPIAKLYTNDGSGIYTLASGIAFEEVYIGSIAFTDVDGDEDADLLITGRNRFGQHTAKLYTNDGNGNYALVSGSPFDGVYDSSIAFADVDGDEDQDVLITGQNESLQQIAKLYTNDGNGNYSLVSGTPFDGVCCGFISFSDVDGDEDQDVLITGENSSGQRIAKLYTNDGNGNYSLMSGTPFDGVVRSSIAFADVDGDEDQDVLITGSNSSFISTTKLYINDGSGNYTLATGTPFDGVTYSSIAFSDVDGDNDADVLITGYLSSNKVSAKLYTNDGSGIYTLATGTPFDGVYRSSIAFADVDGDEDQDVLITGSNSSGQRIAKLYTNDGNGNYALVSGTPFDGVYYSSVAFADLDGDEDQDVLITGSNSSGQRIAKLYTNDGNGNYALISGTPWEGVDRGSIAFADIDGDDDPDLLMTGSGSSDPRVAKLYRNTTSSTCPITASCASYNLTLSPSGTATLQPGDVDNGSTATCSAPILSLSQSEFDLTHIGENTVTLTVQDENGNADTCQAIVTVLPNPGPCRYFLSNHNAQGGSDVYEMFIDEDTHTASLSHLVSVPQRVNLSFNNSSNLLFLGRENNNSATFQTLNPDSEVLGLPISVNVNLSGFTGAAFGYDGMLYAASQTSGAIYRFNPSNFTGSLFSSALVNGGDIDFDTDGKMVLVSRSPDRAYIVNEGAPNTILGPVPNTVSGLARRGDGTFLLSVAGYNKLISGSTEDGDLGVRFDLLLNGAPFTPGNGDLASGCPVPAAAMMSITNPNLSENAVDMRAVLSSQPNPTEGLSTVSFTTVEATRATLEVFDMSGRTVATLFNAEVEAGVEYRSDFNGAGLPNGVYFYRLTTENEVVVSKFMIAK